MKRCLAALGAGLLLSSFPAHAFLIKGSPIGTAPTNPLTHLPLATDVGQVYTGCAAVPNPATGTVYYSDPSALTEGNGSLGNPFRSMDHMIADGIFFDDPDHSGPHVVGSGTQDTLYLLPGSHGNVLFHGWNGVGVGLDGFNYSTYLTIAGIPSNPYGATLTNLQVYAGKIAFRNFTVQSLNTTGTPAEPPPDETYLIWNNKYSANTFYDSLHIQSTDDTTFNGWTMAQSQANVSSGISNGGTTDCATFSNNIIKNVNTGLATTDSTRILISANTINRTTGDGIDYSDVNERIVNNQITNAINNANALHYDFIQGQPGNNGGGSNTRIDHNTGIRRVDSSLDALCTSASSPSTLKMCFKSAQGIDLFDGVWSNLQIDHNVTIGDSGQMLAFYGVNGLVIDSNIVGFDTGLLEDCDALPCTNNPQTGIINNNPPGITITKSKTGVSSLNTTITNNFFAQLQIDYTTPLNGWTNSGNIAWQPGNIGLSPPGGNVPARFAYPTLAATIAATGSSYDTVSGHISLNLTGPSPYTPGPQMYSFNVTGDAGCMTMLNYQGYTISSSTGNTVTINGPTGQTCTNITGGNTAFEFNTVTTGNYPVVGTCMSTKAPSSFVNLYDITTPSYDLRSIGGSC